MTTYDEQITKLKQQIKELEREKTYNYRLAEMEKKPLPDTFKRIKEAFKEEGITVDIENFNMDEDNETLYEYIDIAIKFDRSIYTAMLYKKD